MYTCIFLLGSASISMCAMVMLCAGYADVVSMYGLIELISGPRD